MASLGSFGVEHPPVEDSFSYFGDEIRVHPDLTDLRITAMFGVFNEASEDGGKIVTAIRLIGETLVHPDDVERFWLLSEQHRQTIEDLATLAGALLGALTGRPTKQPSDSSDGLSSTVASSTGDSSSPALEVLSGRPDLQMAVLRAEKARAS